MVRRRLRSRMLARSMWEERVGNGHENGPEGRLAEVVNWLGSEDRLVNPRRRDRVSRALEEALSELDEEMR